MADPLAKAALEVAADLIRLISPSEAQAAVLSRLGTAGFNAAYLRLEGRALDWSYDSAHFPPTVLSLLKPARAFPFAFQPFPVDKAAILRTALDTLSPQYFDLEENLRAAEGISAEQKRTEGFMRAMGIRRGIHVPVAYEGCALGILVLWGDSLTAKDCEILAPVGRMLGSALRRSPVPLEDTPTSGTALHALQSIIATLSVDQPIEQSLATIRDAIPQVIPGLLSPIFALRDDEKAQWDWRPLFPAWAATVVQRKLGGRFDRVSVPVGASEAWKALSAAEPVLTTDAAELVGHILTPVAARGIQKTLRLRCVGAFPLATGGQVLGLMFVCSRQERFEEDQQALLRACASSIALAIANARLYQRQRQTLRLMMQVPVSAESFMLAASAPQRLQTIVDEAIALFDADAGALWAVRDGDAEIKTLAYRGLSARYVQLISEGGPHAAFKRAMELLVPTRVNITYAKNDTEDVRAAVDQEGVRSAVASPLLAGNALRGILMLFRKRPAPFSDETLSGVHVFSRFSALAYESMRLMENSDRRLAEVEVLKQVLQALAGQQDMRSISSTIVEHACRLTDSDSGAFYLWDPARQRLVLQSGTYHGEPLDRADILESGEGLAGTVFETLATVRLDDYYTWPRSLDFVRRKAVGPALGVPIHLRGEVIGTLGVMRDIPKPSYDDDDVELVEALADEVAVSVAQARLGEERDRQYDLTQRILDANPSILVVCDARTTNTILVNRRFVEITGWAREEVMGRPWLEQCIPLSWRSRVTKVVELLREEGCGLRFFNPILAKDSREIPVEWYNAIVRGEDGTPLYIVSNGILAEE